MIRKRTSALLGAAVLLVYGVLSVANLWLGDLNQDEGWYLYAAQLIGDGKIPFVDFAYTQGPVLPYVYALANSWVDRLGLFGGRLLTWNFGLASLLVTSCLSARIAPKRFRLFAFILTLSLVGINVYHSYYTTVVKTYSLCSFFLATGFFALSFARARPFCWGSSLAGFLLVLASATRVSVGMAVPVVLAYLWVKRDLVGPRCWICFLVSSVVTAVLVFLPLAVQAPASLKFGLLDYHAMRSAGGMLSVAVYKLGFLSRFLRSYFVLFVLGVAGYGLFLSLRREGPFVDDTERQRSLVRLLLAVAVVVSLVHGLATFPYDDYQVVLVPLFAVFVVHLWVECFRGLHVSDEERSVWALRFLLFVLVTTSSSAFSAPLNQEWFTLQRDRIWWRLKPKSPLAQLQEVAEQIQPLLDEDRLLLTQDIYLAVEANCRVPEGFEMGPFSYYPSFSTEKARSLRVLNQELMLAVLKSSTAPVAAFSGYGLSIASPSVTELSPEEQEPFWGLIAQRYVELESIPYFGQAHTPLRLFKRQRLPRKPSSP